MKKEKKNDRQKSYKSAHCGEKKRVCSMNKFSLGSYNKEALVAEHDYSFRGLIRIVTP